MSKPKKPKVKTSAEIAQSIGDVKPYTVIHESKKYKKPKHKKREEENNYE